jgi:hypothetical protein
MYGYIKCSKQQQGAISKVGAQAMMKVAAKGAEHAKNQI